MPYEMIVEVGQYQMVVPFLIDNEDDVSVSHTAVEKILKRWADGSKDGQYKVTNKGELRVYFGDVRNDVPFDEDWNLKLRWLVGALPTGALWYGPSIGQPDPFLLVKATDAASAVIEKFNVPTGVPKFTIGDMRIAAKEAALSVLTARA